jgi:TRAP-type transport system small permease protein
MRFAVESYFALLKVLMALLLAGMVVLVFGNVVLRYAFNQGLTASEELSRLFFVWLIFLGAVVALRERGHIGIDTLLRRLPRPAAKACLTLSGVLALLAIWLLLKGSVEQAVINLDVASPAVGYPMALMYGAGIAFAVPAALIILADLARLLLGRAGPEELILVRDSEELAGLDAPAAPRTAGKR